MTFDFAPDWMQALKCRSPLTPVDPAGSAAARGLPAPPHLDAADVATLVKELFAEGSLTADQLVSLAILPELEPYLRSVAPR